LIEALTHTSFASENDGVESYERLEFLGDAVLELVTTEIIYSKMADESEGPMTKVRAAVVDESTLAGIAASWELPSGLRLGVGEERSGGRERPSILSDVVESVVAAVHLDGGYGAAADVIERTWSPIIDTRIDAPDVRDSRSKLQELLAKRGQQLLFEYERSGPDHAVAFVASAIVDGVVIGTGTGGSKKAAAIDAASSALER
jgi:ribonuclease-3